MAKCALDIEHMGLKASMNQLQKWALYLQELREWNRVYNLTAVKNEPEMLSRHIYDSLSIAPYLAGSFFVDVGSGAGLPGIPLAIYFPKIAFTLVESSQKRVAFLRHIRFVCKLDNVQIEHAKVQELHLPQKAQGVLARAFAPLPKLLSWTQHLIVDAGFICVFCGGSFQSLPSIQGWNFEEKKPLQYPGQPPAHSLLFASLKSRYNEKH